MEMSGQALDYAVSSPKPVQPQRHIGFPSGFKAATIFKLKSQISWNSTQFLAEDGREGPHAADEPRALVSLCPGLADSHVPNSERWLHGKAPGTTEDPPRDLSPSEDTPEHPSQ